MDDRKKLYRYKGGWKKVQVFSIWNNIYLFYTLFLVLYSDTSKYIIFVI